MTVLIAGAGIGGLTLALSLRQVGLRFRIFEAMPEIRALGVGINLQPAAVRELVDLGLGADLERLGLPLQEVAYYSRHGQWIWTETRGGGLGGGYHWPQYAIHRGALQMLLLRRLQALCGADVVETGRAVTGWTATPDGLDIGFETALGGRLPGTVSGTVLVAADGINSALRRALYPKEKAALWGGATLWRGVSEGPALLGGATMVLAGDRQAKFQIYPIPEAGAARGAMAAGGVATGGRVQLSWIATLRQPQQRDWPAQDWNRRALIGDVLPGFDQWRFDWLDVPAVIRAAKAIWEFPMLDRDPLPQWSFGNVTLLGDAAHAMYPNGSNGASQSILDARYLARELREHGVGQAALESYDQLRREVMNALLLMHRKDGPDAILDIVGQRAPQGFEDIETVMPRAERQAFADRYRKVAGMDIRGLNSPGSVFRP